MSRRMSCLAMLSAAILFALSITTPAASVFSHYSFDSDFMDDSGNTQHGTLTDVGTPSNTGIINSAGDYVFGGGALDISSDRDYVALPSKTFGSGSPYSISFWARKAGGDTGDAAAWDMVIGDRDNTIFFIGLNDGTGIRWRSNTGASGNREVNGTTADDTVWHHYVVVADGTALTMYVDGAEIPGAETGVATGFTFDTIGEAYNTSRDFDFHGQLDEVWVFDEALTPFGVNGLFRFNNATVAPEPGTYGMMALGAFGAMLLGWRRRRRNADGDRITCG